MPALPLPLCIRLLRAAAVHNTPPGQQPQLSQPSLSQPAPKQEVKQVSKRIQDLYAGLLAAGGGVCISTDESVLMKLVPGHPSYAPWGSLFP